MTDNSEENETPSKLHFTYIKSNLFRVVHADGLVGSITPKNDLFLSFYNERSPLPDSLAFEITPEGRLGKEIVEDRKIQTEGILREMEVGIVIDMELASNLVLWLTNMIQRTEMAMSVSNNGEGENQ